MKIIRSISETASNKVYITHADSQCPSDIEQNEWTHVKTLMEDKATVIELNRYDKRLWIVIAEKDGDLNASREKHRKAGDTLFSKIKAAKCDAVQIENTTGSSLTLFCVLEGLLLGSYSFLKYKTSDKDAPKNKLERIIVNPETLSERDAERLNIIKTAVFKARDLVNEPSNELNAEQLADAFVKMAGESGIRAEVFNKAKIESLKMGGLLAVNKGSVDPPTFTVLEYKPTNAVNAKPYVIVGKGVVYDTGGLSLKPTANSMDYMKCDMAGGAAAGCAVYAAALAKLPLWIIAMIPATDNRPGFNAFAPGDIIKMFDGSTVEMLNSDAEGRMILADALSYAKKYDPEMVIDLATLTGSAAAAVGHYGIVGMGNTKSDKHFALKESGNRVYERIAEFPFWEDYDELLKSDIADVKNIGGPTAGAITAGKFLVRFTDYPWYHLDIAGPAYISKADSYRGKAGTGYGVRLLFDFFETLAGKEK